MATPVRSGAEQANKTFEGLTAQVAWRTSPARAARTALMAYCECCSAGRIRSSSGLIHDAFADPDPAIGRRVQTLVLIQSKAQIGRERAFVAAANFDVFPESLQTIREALTAAF